MKKKAQARPLTRQAREELWFDLTWTELKDWAGSEAVEMGRACQNHGAVHELGMSSEGELLAWVNGGSEVATRVRCQRADGTDWSELQSSCSCSVGTPCKHAVAVVLEALEVLEAGNELPETRGNDSRWRLAGSVFEENVSESSPKSASVEDFLRSLKKAELVEFLLQICEEHPEVKADIVYRRAVSEGDVAGIVEQLRCEIVSVTMEDAWVGQWNDPGNTPDYSRIESTLASLVDSEQYDAVVEVGRELFTAGHEQIDRCHDDGEVSSAVSSCMSIVLAALLNCSLPDHEKILYAIDLALRDESGFVIAIDRVTGRKWSKRVWSAVADVLAKRLDSGESYLRDRSSSWRLFALEKADRDSDVDEVCEAEAVDAGSYGRWVERLIKQKRYDEAIEWAERGYSEVLDEWPGVASDLRDMLRDLARRRRQWPLVAAFEADEFFNRPSVAGLERLLVAAKKADCAAAVRKTALRFLETGKLSLPSAWPLPATRLSRPEALGGGVPRRSKYWHVLRDFAIGEDRPADVLRWHDRLARQSDSYPRGPNAIDLRVAEAVASTHPERAIDIFRAAIPLQVTLGNPDAYAKAGELLRRVRELLQASKRSSEWPGVLSAIREKHHRKWRLMEILDDLEGQPIVRTQMRKGSGKRNRR